jgi:hypothetical protein
LLQELLNIGLLGPEHLRWRMTTDLEIEIALDRRGAPVDVRVAQTLATLRWKRAEEWPAGSGAPSNASSPVREVPANSCLPPGQNEKHNIVWHRFVPQRSNQDRH